MSLTARFHFAAPSQRGKATLAASLWLCDRIQFKVLSHGMDDELEDKVFYQTYISHMKLLSRFAMGVPPLNSTLAYIWKLLRLYFIRPEVLLVTLLFIVFLVYLQALEMWSRGLVGRIGSSMSFGSMRQGSRSQLISSTMSPAERQSWEERLGVSAVYAIQGRRPRMEDR